MKKYFVRLIRNDGSAGTEISIQISDVSEIEIIRALHEIHKKIKTTVFEEHSIPHITKILVDSWKYNLSNSSYNRISIVSDTSFEKEEVIRARVTPNLKAKAEKLAEEKGMNVSELIRYLLQVEIEKNKKEIKKMKKISLNNGRSYFDAREIAENKEEILKLWDVIVASMDGEIREQVHAELAPCSDLEFLKKYLEIADDDICIG